MIKHSRSRDEQFRENLTSGHQSDGREKHKQGAHADDKNERLISASVQFEWPFRKSSRHWPSF